MATLHKIAVLADRHDLSLRLAALASGGGIELLQYAAGSSDDLDDVLKEQPKILLLDLVYVGADGLQTLRRFRKSGPHIPVVVVVGMEGVRLAVAALQCGAVDVLTDHMSDHEFGRRLRGALSAGSNKNLGRPLHDAIQVEWPLSESMGSSPRVKELQEHVNLVGTTRMSVLICGETGTGKELVAREVHAESKRRGSRFLPIDCGAIPDSMVESEFFGHAKGAFTGADRNRRGLFEAAGGGTLFLDEITNLSLATQGTLLRVLQEKCFQRLGETSTVSADVRIIAASNRDLRAAADEATFRLDLYHRLAEYVIHVPSLRERPEDVEFLAHRFLEKTHEDFVSNAWDFTPAALESMRSYPWPGNVRELRNIVFRAALLANGMIDAKHLGLSVESRNPIGTPAENIPINFDDGLSMKSVLAAKKAEIERSLIRRALIQASGNKAQAARLLKIDYKSIHSKVKRYGLQNLSLARMSP
jgi:DNA-binding NtrC family response regulator